jgi:hypothetical protein
MENNSMNTSIKLELGETFGSGYLCHLCGFAMYSCDDPICCEGIDPTTGRTVRACSRCVRAGNVDKSLEQAAERFENSAAVVRSLIGRVQTPAYAEWQARRAVHDIMLWQACGRAEEDVLFEVMEIVVSWFNDAHNIPWGTMPDSFMPVIEFIAGERAAGRIPTDVSIPVNAGTLGLWHKRTTERIAQQHNNMDDVF